MNLNLLDSASVDDGGYLEGCFSFITGKIGGFVSEVVKVAISTSPGNFSTIGGGWLFDRESWLKGKTMTSTYMSLKKM